MSSILPLWLIPTRRLTAIMLVFFAFIIIGCSEVKRPVGAPPGIGTLPPWGSVSDPSSVKIPVAHGKSAQVLVVSGGGANIAFTAGLINGWAARGGLPDFDVVTGVSAGALVSTFIFLGQDYDEELRQSVLFQSADDIIRRRSILDTIFNVSLGTSTPLEKRLYKFITDDVIEKVAQKYKKGYGLFVGSTDLDNQQTVVWDLGAIAASNYKNRRDIYIKAILASASVPLLFNPVYFPVRGDDGKPYHTMHVDGGVIENMLLRKYMLPKNSHKGHIHVIHNDTHLIEKDRAPVKPKLLDMAQSVFETSFSNTFSLLTTVDMIKAQSLGYKSFKLTSIPSDIIDQIKKELGEDYSSLSFSPEATKLLYSKSFELAKTGKVVWVSGNKATKNHE